SCAKYSAVAKPIERALRYNCDVEPEWKAEAREQFEQGYQAQVAGRLEEALEHYRRSLDIQDTAEGHTFLGWAMAHHGRHEEAIEGCRGASAVDPSSETPNTDRGSFPTPPARADEAIAGLERARRPPR